MNDQIILKRGDTDDIPVFCGNDTDGNPKTLVGSTVSFTVRTAVNGDSILALTSAAAEDIELTDPANGICVIHIDSTDTSSVDIGYYYYDIEVLYADTTKKTVVLNHFILEGDLTTA